jgi:hypothetical protein
MANLASGINNVAVIVDAIIGDRLGEAGLDGWVVGLDEVILDVLDHERRLACRVDDVSVKARFAERQ